MASDMAVSKHRRGQLSTARVKTRTESLTFLLLSAHELPEQAEYRRKKTIHHHSLHIITIRQASKQLIWAADPDAGVFGGVQVNLGCGNVRMSQEVLQITDSCSTGQ